MFHLCFKRNLFEGKPYHVSVFVHAQCVGMKSSVCLQVVLDNQSNIALPDLSSTMFKYLLSDEISNSMLEVSCQGLWFSSRFKM